METKNAGLAIVVSNKIGFNSKAIIRDKKGPYIMIKESIHQEAITVNTYTPSIGAPKYIKQLLTDLKAKIDSNATIVGNFNTPL